MKVAFDVKGTIEGYNKETVLRLFKGLQAKGHKCVVWSNLYSYAVDAIKDNGLTNTEAMDKMSKFDLRDRDMDPMDLAIEDDRSQTWLGAKRIIFVDELDDAMVDSILQTA